MSFVINDIVKMEWEKSRWIQTKAGKNKRSAFILACKEYETENGVVPVFFTANKAFLFVDDEGLWSFQDIKNFINPYFSSSSSAMKSLKLSAISTYSLYASGKLWS